MKILVVLTSHDRLGDTGQNTGFWLEEFTTPYYVFKDGGAEVVLASPNGGQPPLDPKSDEPGAQTESTARFANDVAAKKQLVSTLKLSDIKAEDFDGVFYPGGHGPMWDMPDNPASVALLESFVRAGKPIAAVCHAPAALVNIRDANGDHLVKGRKVTGFSNTEEDGVGLSDTVPFLLEDKLKEQGGMYSKGADWDAYAVADGKLITGQNPASSKLVAQKLLEQLKK